MEVITDLSDIEAVSKTLCATAERTGHHESLLSLFRRLLLYPSLGSVNGIDVGSTALQAVEESARRIFTVAQGLDVVEIKKDIDIQPISIEEVQTILTDNQNKETNQGNQGNQNSQNGGHQISQAALEEMEGIRTQLDKHRARAEKHATQMAQLYEALNNSRSKSMFKAKRRRCMHCVTNVV